MALTLSHPTGILEGKIQLTASKSESNRALIIQALCEDSFEIENLSTSDDTTVLQTILNANKNELFVNLSGTAMRFSTAFCAIQTKEVVITGAKRMKERPIKVLVEALRKLGAEITYLENEGYPPLKIVGKKLMGDSLTIDGSVSSQYISALLMIAPKLKHGLSIQFEGEIVSKPYIKMTLEMMQYFGADIQWEGNTIVVQPGKYKGKKITIEADWSAASYWYSMVALAKKANIVLTDLKKNSWQGDAVVQEIYKPLGVQTSFVEEGLQLTKLTAQPKNSVNVIDFVNCPDLSQTVAVTAAALNIATKLTGLKTLRIKETDRIEALKTELTKLGFEVDAVNDTIIIHQKRSIPTAFSEAITTYDDHRMAMAFAPLGLVNPITISHENVVKKSYPNFWKDLERLGFLRC